MKKSFTLIELIVVIAIIAILAAIIAPNAFKAIEKAKITKTVADFKTIRTAALSYVADTGAWPWNGAALPFEGMNNGTGFVSSDGTFGWDGPYLEKWPVSQWRDGNTEIWYVYWPNDDWDHNGITESHFVSLRNNTGSSAIANDIMLKIDSIIDNGNLSTGKIQKFLPGGGWFNYVLVD